jgi:two-component system sensor histidine kinase AlgZ
MHHAPASKTASTTASKTPLLPDFCSLPMVLAVVVYGELLAILITLASPRPLASFWTRMGPLSVFVQLIGLFSAALLCWCRSLLERLDTRLSAFGALLLIIAATALIIWSAAVLVPGEMAQTLFPYDGLTGLMIRGLGIAAVVGALLLRYLYLHQQWRSQVEAMANAKLKALQARIRPHFLFNSMNTIANLTQSDPRLAEDIVMDLADLFRAALSTDSETTTLDQELELIRRYLNIERQRLGERLHISWDLQDIPGEARLPPLILQPLVENAVYHGIQPATCPGYIHIVGRYRHGQIHLGISNSLPDPAETGQPGHQGHQGHHMALENISQRLEAMFPGVASVTHSARHGEYLVRLAFPFPWRRHG